MSDPRPAEGASAPVEGSARSRPLTRDQRTTVVYGILCFILVLVVLQLWLLMATMNAYLGEDDAPIWPAAVASLVCLLLNLGLLRYLYQIERAY
jgi:heme A synthase